MVQNGLLASALMAAFASGLACAEPITYQGTLNVNGMPATGIYDLECRIFDAALDGVQLGETVIIDDLAVPAGVFSVEMDFGEVFDSTDVWLEISVRDGASEDVHDILMPRQAITATPKAIHATKADSLTGLGWNPGGTVFGGGQILHFGQGDDRVLINRQEIINPLEYFGVHITDFATGGIFISNADAMRSTIFAHVTGGEIGASQTFNGKTQEWTLMLGTSEVLKADSSGISAPSYGYTASVTQAVTISGDVFHSALGTPFRASFFGGGAYLSTPGDNAPLVAPVSLPDGAKVTRFVARLEDNAVSNLTVSLMGAQSGGALVSIASVSTEGIAPMVGIQSLSTTEIDEEGELVSAFSTGYYIRVFSSSWPGDSSLRIWSVTVEYTVDAPN